MRSGGDYLSKPAKGKKGGKNNGYPWEALEFGRADEKDEKCYRTFIIEGHYIRCAQDTQKFALDCGFDMKHG